MKIGIPKEIKVKENRVAGTPASVRMFVSAGHDVLVQKDAGLGSGFPNQLYQEAGATIVPTAADAWSAQMVLKVKEPVESRSMDSCGRTCCCSRTCTWRPTRSRRRRW